MVSCLTEKKKLIYLPACSIDSSLTRFFNKVEAVRSFIEQSESEVLSDVEMSYIQLVQQIK